MVLLKRFAEVTPEVEGDGALAFLGYPVVVLHDWLNGLCGFLQIIVRHLQTGDL